MAKKDKRSITSIDLDLGIGEIIPSTQEAYTVASHSQNIRSKEKTSLASFKRNFLTLLRAQLKNNKQFPTNNEIFIFIVQYFISEKEYRSRDIDNMAKTILDVLKEEIYIDDGLVKTLLVSKKIEPRIKQKFAYVAVKELKDGRDIDILKTAGIERSVILFQELKSQGVL